MLGLREGEPDGFRSWVFCAAPLSERPGEFRITFRLDGRVAGLYFLRPGVAL